MLKIMVVVAKLLSCQVVSNSLWPSWTAAPQASLSLTISWCLPKFVPMASVHCILCQPLFLQLSILPNTSVFSFESAVLFRWPKYCSFSFNIRPSNEYSGLIAFRIDWFDLCCPMDSQHHSSKASILCFSAFFVFQLSQLYVSTGKNVGLTIWTLSANWCLSFLTYCLGLS